MGRCLRFIARLRMYVDVPYRKTRLKMVAITGIALVLYVKTSQSSHDGSLWKMTVRTAVVITFWALFMHLLFQLINTLASIILRLPLHQKKCVIILASQKTLSQALAASALVTGLGKYNDQVYIINSKTRTHYLELFVTKLEKEFIIFF